MEFMVDMIAEAPIHFVELMYGPKPVPLKMCFACSWSRCSFLKKVIPGPT